MNEQAKSGVWINVSTKVTEEIGHRYHQLMRWFCPLIYCLLYTDSEQYKPLKTTFGFLYGIILGFGFYHFILVDLQFTEFPRLFIGGFICLLLGWGNATSTQVRCISFLAFPNFCGKAGRGVLKAIILGYLVAGPIQNLANNGREVVRVFTCSASLTYNLTKTRVTLMFKPFQQALLGVKTDFSDAKRTLRNVKGVVKPLKKEMEGKDEMKHLKEENDYIDDIQVDSRRSKDIEAKYFRIPAESKAARYEKEYLKKLEYRCEDIMSRGAERCRDMFKSAYDKCYKTVSWVAAWLLCWPMKLTFICNIVQALKRKDTCDASKNVEPGFGEGYTSLLKAQHSLADNFQVKVQYQVLAAPPVINVRDAQDTARAVMAEFETKKIIFELVMVIVKRLLAFIFLRIILGSQKYHNNYLTDIEFDNKYITGYFRRIDARRMKRDQHTLLPLKKREKDKFIDPHSIFPKKQERQRLTGQIFKLVFEMMTATTFVIFDHLLHEALDVVQRHSYIEYSQTGFHELVLRVRGTGFIASMVRSVLGGFNIRKRVKTFTDNKACLPKPHKLDSFYLKKIYGTYFSLGLLVLSDAYTQRLKRAICAYFYPKREKKRILFLYNETLKKRRAFFKYMRAKVRKQARQQRLEEQINWMFVLRYRFPKACSWLAYFKKGRYKCLVCEEPEKKDFYICPNIWCNFRYCRECWRDVGEKCYACSVEESYDEDLGSEEDVLTM